MREPIKFDDIRIGDKVEAVITDDYSRIGVVGTIIDDTAYTDTGTYAIGYSNSTFYLLERKIDLSQAKPGELFQLPGGDEAYYLPAFLGHYPWLLRSDLMEVPAYTTKVIEEKLSGA